MNPIVLSPSSRFKIENNGEPRSPSRSPNRRKFYELDPLLANLSPSCTLEALEATDALVSEGKASQDALQDSIAAASTSERALGIRAALAGKKLKEWYVELTGWPWPSIPEGSGFRPPGNHQAYINNNRFNLDATAARNINWEDYYGSVPARLVEEYEHRIEIIKDEMDALDLEALKEFVRDAHATSNSRSHLRRTQGNDMNTDYNHLDDFTAVITATIMQALPTISRLTSILSLWSIRLLVLRQVPGYLGLLEEVRLSMKSAWEYIHETEDTTQVNKESDFTRASILAKRATLETQIFGVGRALDNMLDTLEGREDTLPEEWIDDMESTEAEFGDWVVESEKKLIESEWKVPRRNSPAGFSEIEHNHPLENSTAVNVGPEAFNAIDVKIRESSEIDGFPFPFPVTPSRSISPLYNHSEEHKESEVPQNLDPEEGLPNLSSSIPRCSSILPDVSQVSTSCNKQVAPESQKLAIQSIHQKGFQESLVQNEKNEMPESSSAQVLLADPPDVIEDRLSLDLKKDSSHRSIQSHSGLNEHEGEIHNGGIPDSPVQPQSDIRHFLGDQPNPRNIQQGSLGGSDSSDNNDTNTKTVTPDIDISRLSDAVDSSALESSKIQLSDFGRAKRSKVPRPAPLVLRQIHSNIESTASSEMSSDTSYPGSGTSEYFSNMSSPEIQHASVAEFFENPVEITTPSRLPSTPLATISRQSSQRTERGEIGIHENGSPESLILPFNQRRRASTFAPASNIPEMIGSIDESPSYLGYLKSHIRVRSASLRSFEIIPRKEVRNITISRKGSYSCTTLEPSTLESSSQGLNTQSPKTFPVDQEFFAEPFKDRPKLLSRNGDDEALIKSAQGSEDESLSPTRTITPKPSPRVPTKPRHRFESVSDLSPGSTPVILRRKKTADSSSNSANHQTNKTQQLSRSTPSKSSEDQLEERISSILTEIPGHIQLRSGPEPDAREVLPSGNLSDRKKSNVLSPALKMTRARTSVLSPSLTLSPAHPKMSRSRTQVGEPEVKLYHLHQVGKDVPVKLFVRLVGEGGERVMVRIGGGWADLGEYLKEYASHHGRRSVSDGRFEIQGLPQTHSTTPMSALFGGSSPAASPASRPNSSSAGAGSSTTNRRSRHSASSSADFDGPMTPDNHVYREFEPTPGSVDSNTSSIRPPSHSSSADDDSPLGLAGPKTRRKDVSPRKQAWVDGMIDQARKASAEKKKGQDGDFGDLGKVGATKRVFLKSRRDT